MPTNPQPENEPWIDCRVCGPQPPFFKGGRVLCPVCNRFVIRTAEYDQLAAAEAAAPALALTPEYFARRRATQRRVAYLTD